MKDQKKKQFNQYIRFSGIAFQMGVIIGAGAYLGIWLDKKLPNDFSGFTVACSLLSVFIALFIVIKQLRETDKNYFSENGDNK